MFKFSAKPIPIYSEDDNHELNENENPELDEEDNPIFNENIRYKMILKYDDVITICLEYNNPNHPESDSEDLHDIINEIKKILNGQEGCAGWFDVNGNEPSISLKNDIFCFSSGHWHNEPNGSINLCINYNENKMEIAKFLNFMLETYL